MRIMRSSSLYELYIVHFLFFISAVVISKKVPTNLWDFISNRKLTYLTSWHRYCFKLHLQPPSHSFTHTHTVRLLVASRGRKTHRLSDRCGSVCGENTSLSGEPRWWKQTEQYPRELMRTENNLPPLRNGSNSSEEKNIGAFLFSLLLVRLLVPFFIIISR